MQTSPICFLQIGERRNHAQPLPATPTEAAWLPLPAKFLTCHLWIILATIITPHIVFHRCLVASLKASCIIFLRSANLSASASMHRHTCTSHPNLSNVHRCVCLMFANLTYLFFASWRAAQPCTTTAGHADRGRLASIACKISAGSFYIANLLLLGPAQCNTLLSEKNPDMQFVDKLGNHNHFFESNHYYPTLYLLHVFVSISKTLLDVFPAVHKP